MTSVAVIGAGAVGGDICRRILAGSVDKLELAGVLTRTSERQLPDGANRFGTLEALLEARPQCVVEAATHAAVRAYAEPVLRAGAAFLCVSVGALVDLALLRRLTSIAATTGGRLLLPSGAIGGLDALRAAATDGLQTVRVEQRKPARSLLSPRQAAALAEPAVVFEGTVLDAVSRYPATTNVLAAVALAGLGPERTLVRILADPRIGSNQATLSATGAFGTLTFNIANQPSENPRSSMITALSVMAALRNLGSSGVTFA